MKGMKELSYIIEGLFVKNDEQNMKPNSRKRFLDKEYDEYDDQWSVEEDQSLIEFSLYMEHQISTMKRAFPNHSIEDIYQRLTETGLQTNSEEDTTDNPTEINVMVALVKEEVHDGEI